ncbi:lipase family protein [Nocardia brasiliensis]|uniref:lipase family protein n=1 Tax=Nocardia brasiliensis TaxID=37326 RepID=UPI00367294A0
MRRAAPLASSSATLPVDVPYFRRLNALGYAVVSTDYLGMSPVTDQVHPYLNSRTEATATIDIVRAARQFTDTVSNSWAVFGVSQGGHAALATARLASTYAPELDFRGAAASAPGSQLEYLFPLAGPHIPRSPLLDNSIAGAAVLVSAFLAGMWATDPSFDLTPYQFDLAGTEYEYRTFDTDHQGIMGPGFDAGVEFLRRVLPTGW